MAEDNKGKDAAAPIVRGIMDLFLNRKQRRAVKESSTLRFWEGGMLKHLRAIADGKETPTALREIRKALSETEDEVLAALVALEEVRNQLGGGPVAKTVDLILNDKNFGKSNIREEINLFLGAVYSNKEEREQQAWTICYHIDSLNAALDRLFRLVYE